MRKKRGHERPRLWSGEGGAAGFALQLESSLQRRRERVRGALRGRQQPQGLAGDSGRKSIDEGVDAVHIECPIHPAVALGDLSVDVVVPEDDLQGTATSE